MNLFGKPKKKDDVGLRSHLVLEETKIVDKKTFDTDPLAVARQSVHDFNRELKESASRQQAALNSCLLYTSPSPRDATLSRMPSSA